MSRPLEKDSVVADTTHKRGMLAALQSSLRTIRGHLGKKAVKKRNTSPPSYEAVLQENSWESSPSGRHYRSPSECLKIYKRQLSAKTARDKERSLEEVFDTLFSGTDSKMWWARRNPTAVVDHIRRYLIHCVARDCDLGHLVPLSQSDRDFINLCNRAYERSWTYQVQYGWDKSPSGLQAQACEVFRLLIDDPSRKLGLPFTFFLKHLAIDICVQELPQGYYLTGGPHESHPLFTTQALRSRGHFRQLEEVLRSNTMVLDAVAKPEFQQICATLNNKVKADRQLYVPSHLWGIPFGHIWQFDPDQIEFHGISYDKKSKWKPLRQRENEYAGSEVRDTAQLSDTMEDRDELERNPWT